MSKIHESAGSSAPESKSNAPVLPPSDSIPFKKLVDEVLITYKKKEDWLRLETKKQAEDHSKLNATYDELCWFLAEADLNLRNLFALKIKKKLSSANIAMSSEANVRLLSETISQYHNALPDLEWQLAERKSLINLLS